MNQSRAYFASLTKIACLSGIAFLSGCSQSNDETSEKSSAGASPGALSKVDSNLSPGQVVDRFLGSLRSGDHELTASLLTEKAHTETQKHDFELKNIGAPSLQYRVGETTYLDRSKTLADVASVWTDKQLADETSYVVNWILKKKPQGWRISGLKTPGDEGQPLVYFNFEDGADMDAKWRSVDGDAEVARHAEHFQEGVDQDQIAPPSQSFQR